MLGTMREYPPEMYNEILKDYKFRYGKFADIPYPMLNKSNPNSSPKNDTNWPKSWLCKNSLC